ncbi:5-deoxy-glucuronate isomerase [Rheinheimera mangrovi]|uniref:5-deoxy-glucuronate isomerase n=1 Tax=Rheinheimera mangrovi TaxID=2498451 RepID=UPI000F8CAD7D|nr:5-deoxy-glucuronate isomerase [Rheinheimera mangrovi]
MSYLHRKPQLADSLGRIQHITPENANWQYVGFEVVVLAAGESHCYQTEQQELCAVILSGQADLVSSSLSLKNIGDRTSVFEQKAPYALYLPPGDWLEITALTNLEVALCKAPALGELQARLIKPSDCVSETRGQGTNERQICNILFGNLPAERLLITEVITPAGHWSSYPPHKHDTDALPSESALEETYYHKLNPQQGFAFQRVYTDDRRIDETICVEHNSVVLVPEGYHPVGAPHGYQLYYLNVMAGPKRQWVFHNDPQHEWILKK